MTIVLTIIAVYLIMGLLWAGFMTVVAKGQGDSLRGSEFMEQFLLWPMQAWDLFGPSKS